MLTLCFVLVGLCCFIHQVQSLRVTSIGDSITSGGGCLEQSYTEVLQGLLGQGSTVVNAGVSSMTMLKKGLCNDLSPCSIWDTDAWKTALSSKPDVVTIMLGTNDVRYVPSNSKTIESFIFVMLSSIVTRLKFLIGKDSSRISGTISH